MIYQFHDKKYSIERYPATKLTSLQPWNAADELLLNFVTDLQDDYKKLIIFNDRFGFLSCLLHGHNPEIIVEYKSQEKAIRMNLEKNGLSVDNHFHNPLADLPGQADLALIKIPKSLDLFRLYLSRVTEFLSDDAVVACGFMTKYFTPQLLTIAGEFFEDVEQSKARKKARILILRKKKPDKKISLLNSIPIDEIIPGSEPMKQYFGVFSANNIDYATQFLIRNLEIYDNEHKVLDLACGNGILAYAVLDRYQDKEVHLLDDSLLAIESAKLNLDAGNAHFHYSDNLKHFEENYFDLVLSNPPFHFDFESNIEVAIELFHQVKSCLKPTGRFLCVANQHLNYKTHLSKIFNSVKVLAEDKKYSVFVSR